MVDRIASRQEISPYWPCVGSLGKIDLVKRRVKRSQLTHVEVRRGTALRLRVSISDEALDDSAFELGMLVGKVAPTAMSSAAIEVVAAAQQPEILPHAHDDDEFHAGMRTRLAELFGSLCDTALDDALVLGRAEQARRAEGGN